MCKENLHKIKKEHLILDAKWLPFAKFSQNPLFKVVFILTRSFNNDVEQNKNNYK